VSIKYCTKNRIDIAARYSGCRNLFHGLLGSGGNEIEPLVSAALMINSLWRLPDISKLLIRISTGLRDATSTRARLWIRPLRNEVVFPVKTTRDAKLQRYDKLVSPDGGTWFIADQAGFEDAFRGIAPLLAFSLAEITKLSPLFESLGLDSRRLSLIAEENTFPAGRPCYSVRETQFFRSRVLYIKL
jgi:hypothetical protein